MSAKSELKELLEELSEEEAREALTRLRRDTERPPSMRELVRMTPAEQAAVFRQFPPVYDDNEEDREWDAIDDFIDG
ncbi:MAG: hypothetical protein C0506_10960 [Anaerolinea sp.]|nr:hypothetical protein [Anaerolinea sp.]